MERITAERTRQLVHSLVNSLVHKKKKFTAYDITVALRNQNPNTEIIALEVRDAVKRKMAREFNYVTNIVTYNGQQALQYIYVDDPDIYNARYIELESDIDESVIYPNADSYFDETKDLPVLVMGSGRRLNIPKKYIFVKSRDSKIGVISNGGKHFILAPVELLDESERNNLIVTYKPDHHFNVKLSLGKLNSAHKEFQIVADFARDRTFLKGIR